LPKYIRLVLNNCLVDRIYSEFESRGGYWTSEQDCERFCEALASRILDPKKPHGILSRRIALASWSAPIIGLVLFASFLRNCKGNKFAMCQESSVIPPYVPNLTPTQLLQVVFSGVTAFVTMQLVLQMHVHFVLCDDPARISRFWNVCRAFRFSPVCCPLIWPRRVI
jgi:hypothetical protein